MVFYFTSTGNSLHAARQFDSELYSIPQELHKENRHYKADKIGIVCPIFELEVPKIVQKFISESEFETDYFYLIVTYGCHHGGVAERAQEFLRSIGRAADYINTIIMVDNAIIVFDMEQQLRIDPEKKVDEHLAAIKADIDARRKFVQPAAEEEIGFYNGFTNMIKQNGPMYSFPLYEVKDRCVGCGTCTRVCPAGCVRLEDGRAAFDYTNCINCMTCIQACPTKAIQFAAIKEPNPNARYRNPNVTLADIIKSNCQI